MNEAFPKKIENNTEGNSEEKYGDEALKKQLEILNDPEKQKELEEIYADSPDEPLHNKF